tara:strand:- start:127 stop:363 length:237 start_codon:yes stop_codon:yes gene_type:complete
MYRKSRVVDVVEARPAQLFVIDIKAQWFDEMERTASVRTQPKNVACVGWNLGMNQNDVKHRLLPFSLYSALFHHCLSP